MHNLVCVVPIKLNNQRCPNKNISKVNNKPLCSYLFNTLLQCKGFDKIYVYCSDDSICAYLPDGIDFLCRPSYLDQSTTKGMEIYTEFCKTVKSQKYCLAHVTSPFLKASTLQKAIDHSYKGVDSIVSVAAIQKYCVFQGTAINFDPNDVVRTQDLIPVHMFNSAFFFFTYDMIANHRRLISDKPLLIKCDDIESIDVDYPIDLEIAKAISKIPKSDELPIKP